MKVNFSPHRTKERVLADLALFLTALIWGGGFVSQRLAAPYLGFFAFNGVRFLLAGLVMLPFVLRKIGRVDKRFVWIFPAGVILFAASALQQAGLESTSAANGGFLTSVYVVLVPLLLALFWKKRNPVVIWIAALAAVAGSYLLSTGGVSIAPSTGDLLVLAGSILWALHVIVVGLAVRQMDVFVFSVGQFLLAGVLHMGFSVFTKPLSLPGLTSAWLPVLYAGLFSIGIGFTLQAVGQKNAPASDAALILSLESVFAAIGGYFILGETLSPIQILGAVIIFISISIAQLLQLWQKQVENTALQHEVPTDPVS